MVKQLDKRFKDLCVYKRPSGGWIKTIRKALGMTTKQLADRLGWKYTRVVQIEATEVKDSITLKDLREAASAMDCELIYAVVPKKPIEEMLKERAYKIASECTSSVAHTMSLENQATSPEFQEEIKKEYAKSLLEGTLNKLWEK